MILATELKSMAFARLKDAEALLDSKRYDGAVYLCGYVIEFALKARICRNLKWNGFPETNAEFQSYQSFKTHDLIVLARLAGLEAKLKSKYLSEWTSVEAWNPEIRYGRGGTAASAAQKMIESARVLVRYL